MQLTTEPYATLASGLTDADLDPTLLDHFRAWPELTRLILRDQSGEGSLIYAPVQRVTGFDVPYPSGALEDEYLPDLDRVLDGVDKVMAY